MSLVEFTPRAEKSVLDILGETSQSIENTFLFVDLGQSDARISVREPRDLVDLQRDVDVVGPFRVPIGDQQMSLFVRDREPDRGGRYELDYFACGGRCSFQIRQRVGT